jgi:hypothetical protein
LTCGISIIASKEIGYNIVQGLPPANPDLNLIEPLCGLLKASVSRRNLKSKHEIEYFTQEEWIKFN